MIDVKQISAAHSLIYVATPYSLYAGGLEASFKDACLATAQLIKCGVKAFSPIVHSHSISKVGGIDPLDLEIWMNQNAPLMEAAEALVVVQMPGWRESKGVTEEIKAFEAAGKPVHYMEWPA